MCLEMTAWELTVPLPRDSTVPFGRTVVLASFALRPMLGSSLTRGFEFARPLFGAMLFRSNFGNFQVWCGDISDHSTIVQLRSLIRKFSDSLWSSAIHQPF